MPDARTIAFYDAAHGDYAAKFARATPDAQLRAFMALLPPGARVLDLGCGPAFASAHMRAAGFDCDPVDASPGMVETANATFAIGARLLTFDEITMVAAYDGIWANFSLLHAPRADLPRHFHAIARALRGKGLLHVGFKEGTGEARDRLDRFYTYVTEAELAGLLADAGFDLLATDRGRDKGMAGTDDSWIVMRGRKRDG